jgi:hypothetical protein
MFHNFIFVAIFVIGNVTATYFMKDSLIVFKISVYGSNTSLPRSLDVCYTLFKGINFYIE